MSKLSKFKDGLTPTEAAVLLARLIGEDVTKEDIRDVFFSGWMDIYASCNTTIVAAKPVLEKEQHEAQVALGRYLMTAGEDLGFCWAIHLPCQSIEIDGHTDAMALWDTNGELYALRDNETGEYLTPDLQNEFFFKQARIEPADIYKLAEHANKDEPAPNVFFEVKKNRWCPFGEELYNFNYGSTNLPRSVPAPAPENLPPSLRITVAALLDAATGVRQSHTQASLISSILDRNQGIRGLSESSLQKHFSESNAELSRLRAAAEN